MTRRKERPGLSSTAREQRLRAAQRNLQHAHRRLKLLYDVSQHLSRESPLDDLLGGLVALLDRGLGLRSAAFLLEDEDGPRTMLWTRAAEDEALVVERATTTYAQVGRPGLRFDERTRRHALPADGRAAPGHARAFILLPVVDRRRVIGALQVEGSAPLRESDLVFVSTITNQLSSALSRRAAQAARHAIVEERRARAEEQRREYEALIDNLDRAFVWEADADTLRVSYVSARGESLMGYPRARWLAEPDFWLRHVHQDDRELVSRALRQALIDGRDQRCEHRAVTAQGRTLWLLTGIHLARGEENTPFIQAVSVDITASKEAEAIVHGHLEFARALTASLGEGVLATDRGGRITFLNPAAERLLGVTKGSALGVPADALLQARAPDGAPLDLASGRAELLSGEGAFAPPGRPPFPVSYTAGPLLQAGETAGAVLVFQDILSIERAAAEQRLLAEASAALTASLDYEATLAAVARLAVPRLADVCAVDVIRADGEVERVEVAFADPVKEARHAALVRGSPPRAGWRLPLAEALASGRPTLVPEVTDVVADGLARDDDHAAFLRSIGVRSLLVVPMRARKTTFGALTFIRAESERRYGPADLPLAEELARRCALAVDNARQHAAAQRATLLRDELMATVSHDLRTPLGALLTSASLLLDAPGALTDARARRRLETIARSGRTMQRLIQDLLDVAALEAGRLTIDVAPARLDASVVEALESLEPLAVAKRQRLVRDLRAQAHALIDPVRVQQVLTNLLGNAIKFTPSEGTITMRTEDRDDAVLISVIDTGPGLSAADLPHLFDRFWQARGTARLGTGLGLAISRGIVEAMGGRIWAESEHGHGSSFHVTLPRA